MHCEYEFLNFFVGVTVCEIFTVNDCFDNNFSPLLYKLTELYYHCIISGKSTISCDACADAPRGEVCMYGD